MKSKFAWFGIIALGVLYLGMTAVYADDGQPIPIVNLGDEPLADEDGSDEDIAEALGDFYQDYLYTPVEPCKIVDTRYGGGGFIYAFETRDFHVWGNLSSQGGSNCSAPRGEPLAVHLSVIAVDPDGKGNLQVLPKGSSPGAGLSVNFAQIGTNLANAGTIKTDYGSGEDITVTSRFSGCHAVISVLGYYYMGEPQKVVAAASSGTQAGGVGVNGYMTTLVSKKVTIPTYGRIILMGEASWKNSGSQYLGCEFLEDSSRVDFWYWDAGDSTFIDQHQTRFFLKTVTPGTKTYYLRCYRYDGTGAYAYYRNLTIQFFKAGM